MYRPTEARGRRHGPRDDPAMSRRRLAALAGAARSRPRAGRWLGVDRWVATTELPPLALETSVEVLARDGRCCAPSPSPTGAGGWRSRPSASIPATWRC
jgi:hypothetical protein